MKETNEPNEDAAMEAVQDQVASTVLVDPSANGNKQPVAGQRCVNGRMGPCDHLCRIWGCKYIQKEALGADGSTTEVSDPPKNHE
jgi:hypothetical protein